MLELRFLGLDDELAGQVRETMQAPGYGHPAHREVARGYGPCRQCLRTFSVGNEERILFTHQPFQEAGSLPAPGPVFIHADPCTRYDGPRLPSDLQKLPLVLEAYRDGGHLLAQERIGVNATEDSIRGIFERTNADYVHLRNGEAGCFMARVSRRPAAT